MDRLRVALLGLYLLVSYIRLSDACTAILVGKKATVDGSAMTTHNNDCTDCDIRIVRVPSMVYQQLNSSCPIWPCKFGFPRFHSEEPIRGQAYTKDATSRHRVEGSFPITKPYGYIDQVPRTYSYIDGTYGLINEAGVAMGESTCGTKIVAYGYPKGDALFDVSALGRLALERCDTARCAVLTMGQLGEKYGYYGANDPVETGPGMYEEGGEAMTVIDAQGEAWVFHILPDDSGKSAIWAAQRLKEDHVAVVSNSFIIKEMDLNDSENFLFSDNVVDVAVKLGFWEKNKWPFDFSLAYSSDGADGPGWGARRTWRVFDLVAPSLKLDPDTPNPLPFSVKTERLLTLDDVKSFTRDRFEGSRYDLSVGPAAGPWGNPNRYDGNGAISTIGGYFERAISLHRTSYSFVAQSRPWVPKAPTILWFSQHSPHSSLFVPFYCNTQEMPIEYEYGSLFRLERSSSWWAYAAVNNYAEKQYVFMSQDIKALQQKLETRALERITNIDKKISGDDVNPSEVSRLVTEYTVSNSQSSLSTWWKLLDFLFTKYRDGARLENFTPPVVTSSLFYPSWWLGQVGYYTNGPIPPTSFKPPPVPPPPHPDAKAWDLVELSQDFQDLTLAGSSVQGKRKISREQNVLVEKVYEQNVKGFNLNKPLSNTNANELPNSNNNNIPLETDIIPVAVESTAVSAVGIVSVSVLMMIAFCAGRQYQKRRTYIELTTPSSQHV